MVLFATPALWQYAYARESSTPDPDSLFMLMHAISPNVQGTVPVPKTGAAGSAPRDTEGK
jgi:hypothetical protein